MRTHQSIIAALLSLAAIAATAQELDPSETLQAKSLASQAAQAHERAREMASADVKSPQTASAPKAAATKSDMTSIGGDADQAPKTRAQVRQELKEWNATHKMVVGERNGEPQ